MRSIIEINADHGQHCVDQFDSEADHFIDSDWHMYEDEYGNTYYYNQKVSDCFVCKPRAAPCTCVVPFGMLALHCTWSC